MKWEIEERQSDSVTIVTVRGKLALRAGSNALGQTLQQLVADGQVRILVECSGVSMIDSTGIGALVRCYLSAQERGGKLKLLRPSRVMRTALEVLGLVRAIELFEEEEKAIASFK